MKDIIESIDKKAYCDYICVFTGLSAIEVFEEIDRLIFETLNTNKDEETLYDELEKKLEEFIISYLGAKQATKAVTVA